MADPIEGTAAPQTFPIPDWLEADEKHRGPAQALHLMPKFAPTDPAPPTYKRVEIVNFIFLGRPFDAAQYNGYDRNPNDAAKQAVVPPQVITGVTKELHAFLRAAQRDIFQGYAARQAQRGAPVTKDGFTEYCGVVGAHKSFSPRDGKHKLGAALDIDPKFNPWTVTGKDPRTEPFSGETPANFRTGGGTRDNLEFLKALRRDAMTAYEKSVRFMFGSVDMDTSFRELNANPSEPSEVTFDRYDRVNRALRLHMNCGFQATRDNSIARAANPQPRTFDGMRDAILNAAEAGFFEGGDAPFKATDRGFLIQLQADVVAGHAAMRKVCIYGSWTLNNGVQTFGSSRDPCYGIMSLRRHVVRGLLDVQINGKRLRWGAVHFGDRESGDMMHFDIGALANNLQATTEPNPDGIFFAP